MKKLLAIMVVISMALLSAVAVAENGYPETDCAWDDQYCIENIPTTATITGSSGGGSGTANSPPIIKCKWEYDALFSIPTDECDEPCVPCSDSVWKHDACCCTPGLQVKPVLYGNALVDYYAVVTDPEGVDHVDHVYADIWHPDGTFKYQIELFPVGFDSAAYDKTIALGLFNHMLANHHDLLTLNDGWADGLPPELLPEADIIDELNEELAYLYHGQAEISYCQPGGWYYVGVRAHDGYDAWCDYLYNRYWYIPTAGIDVDFTAIDYGTVAECSNKWVGGDIDMNTPLKPTVRNIGNTPVQLYVYQDDMDFGMTGMTWNVEFDARLTADGLVRVYYPGEKDMIVAPAQGGSQTDPNNRYPGVRIDGILPLCTEEKMDFSIHVIKGFPGETYAGIMNLCALIDMGSYIFDTPSDWMGNAPQGVPDPYTGPADPGPDYI